MNAEGTRDQYAAAVSVWGETYAANKARLEESRQELRAAALEAIRAGVTESEAARLAGVTRMTIRAWRAR